jgi:uncharacterized protein YbjQ (UPF0145 family)
MRVSEYCTHSFSERRRAGWDVDEQGHAICRACGKATYQSVSAAAAGVTADPYPDAAAPSAVTAAGAHVGPWKGETPVLIVTMNDIPGFRIDDVHGDVFGLIVRARNALSNLGASLRTMVGGEVGGYTKMLTQSRIEARHRLAAEARALGANAVVAMRFDCNEIGDVMSEIAAYGTAVTISRLDADPPVAPD